MEKIAEPQSRPLLSVRRAPYNPYDPPPDSGIDAPFEASGSTYGLVEIRKTDKKSKGKKDKSYPVMEIPRYHVETMEVSAEPEPSFGYN